DADAVLIIGSNPRFEASLLNARLRKRWRAAGIPIALIGEQADLRFNYEYLGAGADTLAELANGSLKFHAVLKKAKKPIIIIGQ
ncbi:molybdopterin-dependent oxidoreductase, partial [Escherichia coli]|nr:molybdopterin-dependent oxidoreductase [Escherichia coli]